ncbi:MAG: trypsin-like peptidase domain-containing protein [Bacilli bacterium]|nr:trypsin-like peptidase domain-containing protein [Bacilli bacterium]
MKKIKGIVIILFVGMCAMLTACAQEQTINEIYNVSYTGTVTITELEEAVEAVIKTSTDAVVGVSNYAYSFGGIDLQSTGSGIIYKTNALLKDGSIVDAKETINNGGDVEGYQYLCLTNEHVIADAYKIRVNFDEEAIDSEVVFKDAEIDLAILSFSSKFYLPTLELGDSENLKAGQFVVAIGCPNGIEYMDSASFGIISYVKRYIVEKIGIKKVTNEYIQHDAAISPGNSGGPLLDLNGKVIGINSMKVVSDGTEGMGFSIPINVVKRFIAEYEDSKTN